MLIFLVYIRSAGAQVRFVPECRLWLRTPGYPRDPVLARGTGSRRQQLDTRKVEYQRFSRSVSGYAMNAEDCSYWRPGRRSQSWQNERQRTSPTTGTPRKQERQWREATRWNSAHERNASRWDGAVSFPNRATGTNARG
jgi:hypothetical protein